MNTPLQMLFEMFAGWVNEQQRAVNAYLKEENRVLRELHGRKRLRFSDDQRRRLAAKGHARPWQTAHSEGDPCTRGAHGD